MRPRGGILVGTVRFERTHIGVKVRCLKPLGDVPSTAIIYCILSLVSSVNYLRSEDLRLPGQCPEYFPVRRARNLALPGREFGVFPTY
jgi:hypothetical protein